MSQTRDGRMRRRRDQREHVMLFMVITVLAPWLLGFSAVMVGVVVALRSGWRPRLHEIGARGE